MHLELGETTFEKVMILRGALEACATYSSSSDDGARYEILRRELLKDPDLKARLPSFLRTCFRLDDFWRFIQPKFTTYKERRAYIAEEFEAALSYLEAGPSPAEEAVSASLAIVDREHVLAAWQKALSRLDSDPDGALTSARTLLETVCIHVLDEAGIEYDAKGDLPKLYKTLAKHLNLAPAQHVEPVFRQILGGCHAVVEGLGSLLSKMGDAHGHGPRPVKPAPRHAALAVNLAGSMATFILETWDARREDS